MISLLKRYKKALWILAIPYLLLTFSLVYRTDQTVMLTGGLTRVNDTIILEQAYEETGSFHSVYVVSFDKATLFQVLVNRLIPSSTIYKTPTSQSELSFYEQHVRSQNQERISYMNALIVAFEAASLPIDYQFEGLRVDYRAPHISGLSIGDLIVSINGETSREAMRMLLNDLAISELSLEVKRHNTLLETLITRQDNGRFGLIVYDDYSISDSSPNFTLKQDDLIGGPSGGLIQTLSLYNRLTERDLTYGLKIAGTGGIEQDGSVSAMGGIKQKVFTAHQAGADIFLVNSDNYAEALAAYESIKNPKMTLVNVNTFAEAITFLGGLS